MTLEKQQVMKRQTAAAAKSLQSCPTLCDPIDGSLPGSSVLGILQARILEWAVISFSNAWKWKVKVKLLSRVRHFVFPWTATYQAPPSMRFSRQEYWSRVPLLSPWKAKRCMQKKVICRSRPLVMNSELQSTSKKSWKQQKQFIYLTTDSWMSIICSMCQDLGIHVYI